MGDTTYWDYLHIEEMIGLQGGKEQDESQLSNDEVMFIVVHQIDELWFKLALRELVSVRNCFSQNPVPEQALQTATRGIRRLTKIFSLLGSHFSLMETMTTRDYLGFRDKLSPASGFQSSQLREVEIMLGLSDEKRIPLGHESSYRKALRNQDGSESFASKRVDARLKDLPSLKNAVDEWLYRTPIQGSRPDTDADDATVERFVSAFLERHAKGAEARKQDALKSALTDKDRGRLDERFDQEIASTRTFLFAEDVPEETRLRTRRIRAAALFIESYRELPLLAWPREVVDSLVEAEQAFLIFRQRHARMVERMIGRRVGTGGSAGVDYLDRTALTYRVFTDLWATRTVLLEHSQLPPLENPQAYGFRDA